jgi:Na+-translocating ferredoxin:NAD+ oxidoreductase RnfC subunit
VRTKAKKFTLTSKEITIMTQKQATRQSTKTVQIIARIVFKSDNRKVIYLVRSSNGIDQYEVHMFDGKACSCTCPSRKPCRHMAGAESKEQERAAFQAEAIEKANAREAAEETKWVRMPNSTQRLAHQVNDACLNSLNEMTEQYAEAKRQNPSTLATNMVIEAKRRQQAPLAGASRAFSLMR